jgi:hypothetical protein
VIRGGGRLLAGFRATMFDPKATRDYATSLAAGRAAQAATAPAKVTSAKDYAATLAAGRAAKTA